MFPLGLNARRTLAGRTVPCQSGEALTGADLGVCALEHVTIRCAQLQRTRDFYVDFLGLTEGARPDFAFRGYWLYLAGVPVVHLVEAADKPSAWGASGETVIPDAAAGTGSFDHVAFRGQDFALMRQQLAASGMAFRERVVPGGRRAQLFVHDPEGVLVEINFDAA